MIAAKFKILHCLTIIASLFIAHQSVSSQPDQLAAGQNLYLQGNYDAAFEQLKPLAQTGNAEAQATIAYMHQHGLGTIQDFAKAAQWYQRAVENDHIEAEINLGTLYAEGLGVKQDYALAAALFEKAAQKDNPRAQFFLATMIEKGHVADTDPEKSIIWYQKSADNGYADAQVSLGVLYQEGTLVKQDLTHAHHLYSQAAHQNNVRAQNNLGVLYVKGLGVTKDYTEAFQWFERAAKAGFSKAMTNLGVMYDNGFGVTQSDSKAIYWYRKAGQNSRVAAISKDAPPDNSATIEDKPLATIQQLAMEGIAYAQYTLGDFYFTGTHVPQDYVLAYHWINLALTGGAEDTKMLRKRLISSMTKNQIEKAQAMSRIWYENNSNQ